MNSQEFCEYTNVCICSRIFIQKNDAHDSIQNLPTPSGHGWKFVDNELQVDWFVGEMLLHDIIDLLAERSPSDDDDDMHINVGEFEDVEEDDVVDSIVDVVFKEEDDD